MSRSLVKKRKQGYRRGDGHHNATVSDHEVELIRQLRGEGMTLSWLAKKFRLSKGHVSKLCRYLARV